MIKKKTMTDKSDNGREYKMEYSFNGTDYNARFFVALEDGLGKRWLEIFHPVQCKEINREDFLKTINWFEKREIWCKG